MTKDSIEKMVVEFKKRFACGLESGEYSNETVISFISSLLTAREEEIVGMLEGMKRPEKSLSGLTMPVKQYNNAIDDAIALLKDKGE